MTLQGLYAEEKRSRPPTIVTVDKVIKLDISPTAWYSASVISRDDANLAAEISGRLTWVAEVGDRVKKGESVAKLDDVFIKQQVIEEKATIQSEKAKYDFYSKEVERFEKLLLDNNVARNQLDQAISDQAVARSNMTSATARLTQAQERLRRTNIRAPFDGVVSEQVLQIGEWADDGATIVRLVSAKNSEIKTHIPSSALQFVTIGTPITFSDSKTTGEGKVRALVPVGGDVSRLYEIRIAVKNLQFSVGKLLRVAIPTEHPREALTVPRDALILRREGIYVFKINEDSIAERINVETGIAEHDQIEVIGNIQVGDLVVTRGGENLRSGTSVTIKPAQAGL